MAFSATNQFLYQLQYFKKSVRDYEVEHIADVSPVTCVLRCNLGELATVMLVCNMTAAGMWFQFLEIHVILTHWGRVPHICVSKHTNIGSDNGLAPIRRHNLNQCWNIVNWTLGNKFQWNLNKNSNIFIQENAFENVVWKMAAILSRPQCVKLTQW